MKKRILFVDDDPQLLKSIRRMLWNTQDAWELAFAGSAEAALDQLARERHDVIVADMRMPGMDGRHLLKEVRRLYPWMLRIVLSGDSNQGHILRSVAVAHQFLTKPVPAGQLLDVIGRGCKLRDMILSEQVKSLIGRIDALPAMPATFTRLLDSLEDEFVPLEAIAQLIGKDVGLSADVLKLVNSSFFGPRVHVRDLSQAVTLLGLATIRGLVVGVRLLKAFDASKVPGLDFQQLWNHSLGVARMARRIALLEGLPAAQQEECFIAGLLHDLGKYVLADRNTAEFRALVEKARAENLTLSQAEALGAATGHAQAGAYLLGLWGLPDTILEAVAFHHAPSELGLTAFSAVTAVHAANTLEHEFVRINPGYAPHPLDQGHLQALGLADRLDTWRQACREVLESGEKA